MPLKGILLNKTFASILLLAWCMVKGDTVEEFHRLGETCKSTIFKILLQTFLIDHDPDYMTVGCEYTLV